VTSSVWTGGLKILTIQLNLTNNISGSSKSNGRLR